MMYDSYGPGQDYQDYGYSQQPYGSNYNYGGGYDQQAYVDYSQDDYHHHHRRSSHHDYDKRRDSRDYRDYRDDRGDRQYDRYDAYDSVPSRSHRDDHHSRDPYYDDRRYQQQAQYYPAGPPPNQKKKPGLLAKFKGQAKDLKNGTPSHPVPHGGGYGGGYGHGDYGYDDYDNRQHPRDYGHPQQHPQYAQHPPQRQRPPKQQPVSQIASTTKDYTLYDSEFTVKGRPDRVSICGQQGCKRTTKAIQLLRRTAELYPDAVEIGEIKLLPRGSFQDYVRIRKEVLMVPDPNQVESPLVTVNGEYVGGLTDFYNFMQARNLDTGATVL